MYKRQTIEYEDPDETLEYSNEEHKEMLATFHMYSEDYEEAKANYHFNTVFEENFVSTPTEVAYQQMYHDLYDELRDLPAIMHSKTNQYCKNYFIVANTFNIF